MEQWPEPPALLNQARNILRHELYHASPEHLDASPLSAATSQRA
jgi:hypothetical protein